MRVGDRELLASASADDTVRIWDPATGLLSRVIPTHHVPYALAPFNDGCFAVGLDAGLLALKVTSGERP
ncbi:MAG: hypothetical protein ACRDQU_22925 [Pseudonocardiaceae bacterium]